MKRVGQIFREGLMDNITGGFEENSSVFLLSYSKLSASQVNNLRMDLKKIGAQVFASPNTIARLALKKLNHQKLAERVDGQTLFVWSDADSAEVSKTLFRFIKECESFDVQGGVLDGALLEKGDVKRLADLPPRSVLLAQLLQVIQSPVTRLMGALNGKTRELIYLLKQLSESRKE